MCVVPWDAELPSNIAGARTADRPGTCLCRDNPGRGVYISVVKNDRSRMRARVVALTSQEAGDARMGGTMDQRVAAVAELSLEAWRLSGRPLPTYTRATMPVIVSTLKDHAQ